MPGGLGLVRHPLDGPANPARAHAQSKSVLENGSGIGMGQAHGFVHQHAQRHCLRPHLHRRRSQGIGGLQRVPALHPLRALLTSADRNVEAPHIRPPHNLLLILRVHALDRQRSAAVRALRGRVDLDFLIHVIGDRPVRVGTMCRPRLAPGTLGI
jgi:hypothetical protein